MHYFLACKSIMVRSNKMKTTNFGESESIVKNNMKLDSKMKY